MTVGPPPPSASPLHHYFFGQRGIPSAEVAAGIEVPLRFTDPPAEHSATRRTVGLFDFSFMASFDISGRDAMALLERLQSRGLRAMPPGRIAYTLLCREDGSVLNDATVWCRGEGRYTLYTGRRSDASHVWRCAAGLDVAVEERSADRATCAVQGPLALRTLQAAFPGERWQDLPYFRFRSLDFEGAACDVGRLGYTGEAGFEAIVEACAAPRLWQRLASAGAPLGLAECGFEAANILRVEAGFILFSTELERRVTPLELGLGRFAPRAAPRPAGARAAHAPRTRVRLAGLVIERRALAAESRAADAEPRPGRALITSEAASPLFRRSIGLGFVDEGDRYPGTSVRLQNGDVARVARLPFYDPPKLRPRLDWAA